MQRAGTRRSRCSPKASSAPLARRTQVRYQQEAGAEIRQSQQGAATTNREPRTKEIDNYVDYKGVNLAQLLMMTGGKKAPVRTMCLLDPQSHVKAAAVQSVNAATAMLILFLCIDAGNRRARSGPAA